MYLLEFLFELKVDLRQRQLTKTHHWLRYQGANDRLGVRQRRSMLRAAQALVSELQRKNP